MDLKDIRNRIDEVDGELITLFQKRMDIVKKVAEYKISNDMQVLDSEREHQLIAKRLSEAAPEYKGYTREFLEALLAVSRKMQHDIMGEAPRRRTISKKEAAYCGVSGRARFIFRAGGGGVFQRRRGGHKRSDFRRDHIKSG